ncbi:MAG: metallophosphoesterase [Syntrophorhabdaceae bacterium]|nr:metallophosphoesterase [Syntrophorhabdaceae bacterium]
MHAYVLIKARQALLFGWKYIIPLTVIFGTMVFAPYFVRVLERTGHEIFVRVMAYVGYTWMAALFLFVIISLSIDVVRIFIYITGTILHRDFSRILDAYRPLFFIPLLLSLSIVVYGYFEARNIKTEWIRIKTEKIPERIGSLKILQISDVHLGLIVGRSRLERIIREIKRVDPHILVSTGDLVDGQQNHINGLIGLLMEINPEYGKFAILGNHEFYAGIEHSIDFIREAGFRLLRGEAVVIDGFLSIAGVDDEAGLPFNYREVSEKILLGSLRKDTFTVLLKHRPVIDKEAIGLFDLQLSGHTHKGQIFPFRYFTRLVFPMYNGLYELSGGSHLYVSNGTGTWGPPVRFMAPPEITVIELIYENKAHLKGVTDRGAS